MGCNNKAHYCINRAFFEQQPKACFEIFITKRYRFREMAFGSSERQGTAFMKKGPVWGPTRDVIKSLFQFAKTRGKAIERNRNTDAFFRRLKDNKSGGLPLA